MSDTGSNVGMTIGDCAVNFIADMTQLDKGVDSIAGRVEVGMGKASAATEGFGDSLDDAGAKADEAANEVEDASTRSTHAVQEARGEVALLGEEFGIRLPRHVRSFVAELPGVGEALSSAFAATAILFIIEAIVKATEKMTDFISVTFIYTQAMRDMDAALAASNKTHATAVEDLAKMKKAFEDSLNPTKAAQKAHEDLKEAVRLEEEQIRKLESTAATVATHIETWWDKVANFALKVTDNVLGTNLLAERLQKQHDEAQLAAQAKQDADLLALQDKHNKDVETLRKQDKTAEIKANKAKADDQFEYWRSMQNIYEAQMAEQDKLMAQNQKLVESFKETFASMNKSEMVDKDNPMTLRMRDLVKQLDDAREHMKLLEREMAPFASDFNAAFVSAAIGAEGWGKAMENATGSALKSLGTWCQTKALENLALAAENWENPGPYLAAAAGFEAAALACGVAGAEMSSGGGSSGFGGGSYQGTGTTGNVTSGGNAAPGPATATTRLSAGGLVTAPTLAMIGDAPGGGAANEAVVPLDNPEVMQRLAAHFAAAMGGGGDGGMHFHTNVRGMISDGDLTKVMKKMSRKVQRGTGSLLSSNTHRITKRSA
jgi:hypothetical protein